MSLTVDALRRALIRELGSAGEWVIHERRRASLDRELGTSDATCGRVDHHFTITVYRDREQIRGEATLTLTPSDEARLDSELSNAINRANKNRGPLWSLPRPAAPARVAITDPSLVTSPDRAIADLGGLLGAADRRTRIPRARIEVATTDVRVVTSNQFDRDYRGTELRVDCVVLSGSRRLRLATPVSLRARQLADVDLAAALARAAEELGAEAAADPVPPGVYDLVIDAGALARRSDGGFGWLTPLVAQASGRLARQALSRYQPGQSIYGDAELTGDPITLWSDGAIPFGWRSAPFAERGEAVRRFALIERGEAANLALDAREASLRDTLPNGGVRNLVLEPGARSLAEMATGQRPALVTTAVSWVDSDPRSGDVAAELRLSRIGDKVHRGGQVGGNLFDWLPRLRLGKKTLATTAYRGPRWIGIPAVEVR